MGFPATLPSNPRIVFMGTPDFSVPALLALMDAGFDVAGVVTQPDRPKGRGRKLVPSPVKVAAETRGWRLFQPESVNRPEFFEVLAGLEPDLLVVVAFGQILKTPVLSLPGWGVLNIHASLLPRHRGAAPIQWAVLQDESRTGLTLMAMDEGLDTGPVLFQESVAIGPGETAGRLHDRLAAMSGGFLIRSLGTLIVRPVEPVPQDEQEATYAPKITRAMTRIDWHRPARTICAQIRGLDPAPGAQTVLEGQTFKLYAAEAGDPGGEGRPGRIVRQGEALVVEAGEGRVVVGEIQAPGRKRMRVSDFLRGFPLDPGSCFEG